MKKLLCTAILLICVNAYADTVYFKNGKVIEAEQTWEEGEYIKCLRFGGEISYPKKDIDKIDTGETKAHKNYADLLENEEKNFGNPPSAYEALVRAQIKEELFDPYSVKDLTIDPPMKLVLDKPEWGYTKGQILWFSRVSYNAKNRYGAYTGKKTYIYFFRGNTLFRTEDVTGRL